MRLVVALLALVVSAPAFAHDFFLDLSSHAIDPGSSVSITMRVGSEKEMDELPRSNKRIVRFDALVNNEVVAVGGKHGESPAGTITFAESGIATVVYQSTHTDIELEAEKFEHYLVEEGLDEITAERKRLGVTASPGRESYARYAKSLVTVGDGRAGFDRRVGLFAELVALTDPRKGGTAQFQVFYDGKPRAGATVDILRIEKTRLVSVGTAKSDADGKVSLAIPGNGHWLVATTLMRQAPAELQLEGDWESFWVSITFETGATKPKKSGCGCGAGHSASLLIAFAIIALLLRRRA